MKITGDLVRSFGMSEEEWRIAIERLGRRPTFTELGVLSVMWSEHCSYKSSRIHLKRLPTEGPRVVQGPGENAGAVDIGDGFCAVFKMESHNHPSFIEPRQGAATGVGGILRDVFTMGARPVAILNSLRFGQPEHPRTSSLLRGVVEGIGSYGNCVGVPTVGGEVQFDASYDGNILVNAFALGVAKTSKLFFGRAGGLGNPVLYVGARTGRDGIHGATMASAEFGADAEQKLPTVQVGDPFMEKLLLEACLEIFDRDCLEGVQDMGAAGLTSSSVEMASRAGMGIELWLDEVPRRTKGLTPYELLLSESQERMLMVAKKGRESEVFEICQKWDLESRIIGVVTNTGRFVCTATEGFDPLGSGPRLKDPTIVVDLPVSLLTEDAPRYDRLQSAPRRKPEPVALSYHLSVTRTRSSLEDEILALVGSPNLGSRQWIWRQYDHIVGDGTTMKPGASDAAIIRVFCERERRGGIEKFLALSVDGNGRHVALDPFEGAAMSVAECARNVVCSGAMPLGLTDCLNFGNPENPETMWSFSRAIDGMTEACRVLELPIVSGNVSLYNETEGRSILPTPVVAVVGQLKSPHDRVGLAFRDDADVVALLGHPGRGLLGGSEWITMRLGRLAGEPLHIDLLAEKALQRVVLELAQAHLLSSAHDVSDGGLALCLAESSIAGGIGVEVDLARAYRCPPENALFGEAPSRIIVSYAEKHAPLLAMSCERHGVPHTVLGSVHGERLNIKGISDLALSVLSDAHRRCLDPIVGPDA